ncbi:MAG: hypothetical protein HOC77_12330 [Chloroflexi bacterium]|jgi:membrane protein DedA with SNARE-associated domain|nr:hypothetical protein [Chloroflexota bacterium]MBT4074432.1 hypothetical protein [Chloroflexota bacterium]MBT4515862.1 hypothetical protein [Chloroflexota bacterium]MBT5318493.1 hypothetical protein [Chloroflexota bacterium]MBT6680529.1 hypothetical protein [Chloroflexota bacterium]
MQIAPVSSLPVISPALTRTITILAFAVLFLATGLALMGVDFGGQPASPAVGYTALFLAGLLASVTLFLPVPMIGMVFISASFLNPFAVGLAAAAGISAGLWPTYFAGTAGVSTVEGIERSRNAMVRGVTTRVLGWFRTQPIWASFLLAAIPNPVFDLAGLMAGAAGVPFRNFLLGSFAGKTVQMTVIAMSGYFVAGHISLPV